MAPKTELVPTTTPAIHDEDAPGPPITVDAEEENEGGRLKMIIGLVKKSLGVSDIAAMRLSLPASLLEPIPNLEYWQYLDRPDVFASLNDSEDPFMRMIAVLRFTFTKDLKFIHGKVCKPYNSVLGEHFRSHWDVIPLESPAEHTKTPVPSIYNSASAAASTVATNSAVLGETASVKSAKSSHNSNTSKLDTKSPSTAATSPEKRPDNTLAAGLSSLSLASALDPEAGPVDANRVRVVFLTEQVSHHPPVSAYYAACPSRGVELSGIDQIAAKVSGTTLRVAPGEFNKGLYVRMTDGHGKGESYHITHPIASVNGILRGSFYVTIGDTTVVTCTGNKNGPNLRAVLEYKEESWLGKAHYRVEGVVHTYVDGDNEHDDWIKVKSVPKDRVVTVLEGSWRSVIRWRKVNPEAAAAPASSRFSTSSRADTRVKEEDWITLVDLSTLQIIPKTVRPLDKQLPNESRKLWETVTDNLLKKEFSEATKEKVAIEQKQREMAAERKRTGVEFVPRYFEKDFRSGLAVITPEGLKAIDEEMSESSPYSIEGCGPSPLQGPSLEELAS